VRGVRRTLQMGDHAHIISFHFLDCGGGLLMADDTWLTGIRSTVLSHAFDPHEGGMILEPVELKQGAVVSTSCTMLPGTVIGEGALLAAGSTLWTRQELAGGSLYGGVPARRLAAIDISDWVYNRHRYGGQKTL
jgi:acetyltransferase-like isoleucine patch superfamily enzyme